jgi:hypothetical protein
LLVGWIAIAAVVLEAIGLAFGIVVWGTPALIVVGPLLLATVIVTVVLWLTVIPQRMLRAAVEGRMLRGAPAGWRAAQEFRWGPSGSGSGSDSASSGPAWSSDGGFAADHGTHHGWHGSSDGGWSGGDGTSSGSWSDSTSSSSSDSSSSGASDSSSSSSSDSSSSSW